MIRPGELADRMVRGGLARGRLTAPLPLSPRQAEVLDTIRRAVAALGEPPTAGAVGRHLHVSRERVRQHIETLTARGYLGADGRPAPP